MKKINWKYLVFDIVKVTLPILAVYFLPDSVPKGDVISGLLYILALGLGIDSTQKVTRSVISPNGENENIEEKHRK